jgi:hypothetical protein
MSKKQELDARLHELVAAMSEARDGGTPEERIDLMWRLYELLRELNGHSPDCAPVTKAPRH